MKQIYYHSSSRIAQIKGKADTKGGEGVGAYAPSGCPKKERKKKRKERNKEVRTEERKREDAHIQWIQD